MARLKKIEKYRIDWCKTGMKLQELRMSNAPLRKYVCSMLKYDAWNCSHNCEDCKYEMDRAISRAELARVVNCSDTVIYNWETGETPPHIEDLLFYCDMCGVSLRDIIVFEENF